VAGESRGGLGWNAQEGVGAGVSRWWGGGAIGARSSRSEGGLSRSIPVSGKADVRSATASLGPCMGAGRAGLARHTSRR